MSRHGTGDGKWETQRYYTPYGYARRALPPVAQRLERPGPAQEFVQHLDRRLLLHLARLEPAGLGMEELGEERDRDRLVDGHHFEGGDHLLDHLHTPGAAGDTAVAHEPHRLVCPFVEQVIQRVEERGRRTEVVLRRHEGNGVGALHHGAPRLRVRMLVLAEPRMVGLVQQRERLVPEIHDLNGEAGMATGDGGEPLAHEVAFPSVAGTRDHDLEPSRGGVSQWESDWRRSGRAQIGRASCR